MPIGPDANTKFNHLVYYFDDGTISTSREYDFHQINLYKLIRIEARFKYFNYGFYKYDLPSNFKEFIHFRSFGKEFVYSNGLWQAQEIRTWHLGWSSGIKEYLEEYDFATGKKLKSYIVPRWQKKFPSHFHPQSKDILLNG